MKIEDLEAACAGFEAEHGIEAFLDAMAEIMRRRMARQGIRLDFDDEEHIPHHLPPANEHHHYARSAAK